MPSANQHSATSSASVHPLRRKPARWPPHPRIAKLRRAGWTMEEIAAEIGATAREVYRWAAGDSRPLGIYDRALASLKLRAA